MLRTDGRSRSLGYGGRLVIMPKLAFLMEYYYSSPSQNDLECRQVLVGLILLQQELQERGACSAEG